MMALDSNMAWTIEMNCLLCVVVNIGTLVSFRVVHERLIKIFLIEQYKKTLSILGLDLGYEQIR